jgi:hypothetical protein
MTAALMISCVLPLWESLLRRPLHELDLTTMGVASGSTESLGLKVEIGGLFLLLA